MEEQKKEEDQNAHPSSKQCPQCKADIPISAKKCSQCGSDLRSWPFRHPILSALGIILVIFIFLMILGSSTSNQQQANIPISSKPSTGSNPSTGSTLSNNNPTIKQLGTLTADYVGKSFVLDVNAETDNYYNYGFNDETKYYSLKIWDDSVSGDFEGIYAYLDKNDTNKQLVNALLNSNAKIEVHASIPTAKYESNSNAFLYITSWKLLQ